MRSSIARSLRALFFALALAASTSIAEAQEDDVAESRASSFQAVSGPQQEAMPGGPLLLGAYGAFVALLLGYVLYLGRLQTTSAREIARLWRVLDAAAKPAARDGDE